MKSLPFWLLLFFPHEDVSTGNEGTKSSDSFGIQEMREMSKNMEEKEALALAQLLRKLLQLPEISGLNPIISKVFIFN